MSRKLLITGDSFAADWSVKYNVSGWPNLLAQYYDVTNIAQAGCGQYKILQQLKSQNLKDFDSVIVSHTSPYRIFTAYHPIHFDDKLHHNSDFIYSDVKAHNIESMVEYFEKYFDLGYAKDIHLLLCKEILALTSPFKTLHITHFEWDGLLEFDLINFAKVYAKHPGNANHYNQAGNLLVFNELKDQLDRM